MNLKDIPLPHRSYGIGLGIALLIFLFHSFHIIDFHELGAVDLRLKMRGERAAHPQIVLVEIDDASVQAIGQWPWPRNVHGAFLEIVKRYQPKLVFFDVLFTEKGPDPKNDKAFTQGLIENGKVILPFFYYKKDPFKALFPLKDFREASIGTGFVNMNPDRDGKIRRFEAFLETEQGRYYHPSVLAKFHLEKGNQSLDEIAETLPRDSKNQVWVNYPGSMRTFRRIPFWQIIHAAQKKQDAELYKLFSDAIIILGHTATGTTDLKTTPFTTLEPGVSIQAAAVHTLLTENYLVATPWWFNFLMILAFALFVTWTTQTYIPRHGIFWVGGLFISYTALNLFVFLFLRLILPLFVSLVVILFVYVATLFVKYIEIRFQQQLRSKELNTAARIQENFLPPTNPKYPALDMRFQCLFIKEVGGDLYDWLDFGDGRFAFCVGDVSGKGVPAALYMAKVMSEFRRIDKKDKTPGEVNMELNNNLCVNPQAGMFVTLFYGVVDTNKKILSMSSGGHDPMVFYHAKEKRAEVMEKAQGSPIGLFEGLPQETFEMPYEEGDALVVVTDGIKELRNPEREEFGMERLRKTVGRLVRQGFDAQGVIDGVFEIMKLHQKRALPHDDRTLVCVKF